MFLRLLMMAGMIFKPFHAQVIIHALALSLLFIGGARLPISALACLFSTFNPFLQSFHHTILTESLAFSLTFCLRRLVRLRKADSLSCIDDNFRLDERGRS